MIIFDAVYGILILSSSLYTLGNTYTDKLCTAAILVFLDRYSAVPVIIYNETTRQALSINMAYDSSYMACIAKPMASH